MGSRGGSSISADSGAMAAIKIPVGDPVKVILLMCNSGEGSIVDPRSLKLAPVFRSSSAAELRG